MDGRSANGLTRRHVVRGLVSLGVVSTYSASIARASRPIRFGLTPVFLTNDLELLSGLQTYLSNATGHRVELVQRRTYQEITSLVVSDQIDAAWICGFPFIAYRNELSLVAVPVWRGQPQYQAYLIGPVGSQATSVDDLSGDVHAFSDPDSNSGYLVTSALLAQRGLRPPSFFSRTFFTYGHRNVVRAVASGLANSGSVDGYVWEVMHEIEPELTSRTKVVWRSEWLGFPPVATSRTQSKSPRLRALKTALLEMSNNALGRSVLETLRLDTFKDVPDALFERIAVKVAQVQNLQ